MLLDDGEQAKMGEHPIVAIVVDMTSIRGHWIQ
jgi:hypothetical protein